MNARNVRIRKTYRSIDVIHMLREIDQNFEESLLKGKLVKNLEVF